MLKKADTPFAREQWAKVDRAASYPSRAEVEAENKVLASKVREAVEFAEYIELNRYCDLRQHQPLGVCLYCEAKALIAKLREGE